MAIKYTRNIGGRKLDISFIDHSSTNDNEIGFDSAKHITGIYSLVQRFAHILLTPIGTELTDPSYGTALSEVINSNYTSNLSSLVAIYVVEAAEQLLRYQDEDGVTNLDERLDSVQLLNVETGSDYIDMTVKIIAESGEDLVIILPYSRS